MPTAILWLRRDLRLGDNPALKAAVAQSERLIPVYIHAPEEEAPWHPGAASRWWLHQSLSALDQGLRERGSGLLIRRGESLAVLRQLILESGATTVHWNRCYEPAVIASDSAIKQALRAEGIRCSSQNAALLSEPWELKTGAGEPYRVFTPYWRRLRAELLKRDDLTTDLSPPANADKGLKADRGLYPDSPTGPANDASRPSSGRPQAHGAAPDALPPLPTPLEQLPLEALELRPSIPWDQGLRETWQPGEAGAGAELERFLNGPIEPYQQARDWPSEHGTSRLSPHLHFGEISPRQILAAIRDRGIATEVAEPFERELGWREFSHQLLYHFPQTPSEPLNPRFADFPWRGGDTEPLLRAWQRGQTGIPIVDAGMRELWHSGWMHNRVRMIVASLLTKNLRLPWQEGARWFWDTLVDADLANNTQGWQWSAGCGADAAPYFRIFNPVLQGERFDAKGQYVRRWCPELARLPDRFIHQPWQAPASLLAQCGVRLGRDYPAPIVDLKQSRAEALAAYDQVKGNI
ncbi:cryptochrome/photolyase family protein [Halochromatium roseum]|uniref:cryptochrome/photolyase family protein n=1 Tax=Halochromatium roseum TaxID=391920 RepID=UPI00191379CE|nr:deoxyribodipyrimidine photo-lyase [Halochromatium roseum]MBK5941508.1 deoxyribodipyrimidine photolyase [Halochromatium roseum]